MVGRAGTVAGREFGPPEGRELVGVQPHREPVGRRCIEDARALRNSERDALAERVHGVGEPIGSRARDHRPAHQIEVGVAPIPVLGWERVGGEEGAGYAYIEAFTQSAGDSQHPEFGIDVKPVT